MKTPSGPQYAESELEAELLEQLAFAPDVFDLLTQPIVEYYSGGRLRRYTPDLAIQLYSAPENAPCRYLVEVKRQADLNANRVSYEPRLAAGRKAAEEAGAAFRIMDEHGIRTPYLGNTRLLSRYRNSDPEFETYDLLRALLSDGSLSVIEAIRLLSGHGVGEPDARAGIDQAIAWRLLACDLSQPFNDATIISAPIIGKASPYGSDPIIRALREAPTS